MRIGKLAEYSNVTIDTIRHYMELGLILPEKKGTQFHFDQACVADMEWIAELKKLRFTLQEIRKIISFKRMTNFSDAEDVRYYENILLEKKQKLTEENIRIAESIRLIEDNIQQIRRSQPTNKQDTKKGVPLSFIPLFYCPVCQIPLHLTELSVRENDIFSGSLHCHCNYQATIQDGILLTPHLLNPYNSPFVIYDKERFEEFDPNFLRLSEKGDLWIYKQLIQDDVAGKLVVETNLDTYVFLPKYLSSLQTGALYVFSSYSLSFIKKLKNRIEHINPAANVLYMVNSDLSFPLKSHTIDLVVDSFSCNDFSLFNNVFPLARMMPYLKNDAKIIGKHVFYQSNAQSLRNIKIQFPHSHQNTYYQSYMEENLKVCGFGMVDHEYIGYTTSPGAFFDYHAENERLHLSSYVAWRNGSTIALTAPRR